MKGFFCKAIFTLALLPLANSAFSFSWPLSDWNKTRSIFTFSQNRKGAYCQSLIFEDAQNAVSADKGKVIAVITEKQGDGDWFESTLGNALIISHDDSLISVYGNLSEETAMDLTKKRVVDDEEELGKTGSSSWNESQEGGQLEFQIADRASKTFINPIILMPRNNKPPRLTLENLTIENQFGRTYNLSSLRSIPAGVYKIYKKRQMDVNAYKSEVFVNGAELEKITKEAVKCQNGTFLLLGSEAYASADFYPDDNLELLGHILLPHGSDTITIVVSDIFENKATANFTLSAF